mgnify:CR=1 FL=1
MEWNSAIWIDFFAMLIVFRYLYRGWQEIEYSYGVCNKILIFRLYFL